MIKNHLSKLLGARRITQTKFSRMTGIRRQTINEIYHEINNGITMDNLNKICEILECDISDVFVYIPSSNKTKKTK